MVGKLNNFYDSIRSDLTNTLTTAIGGEATVTSPGSLWGDINMTVGGQPDGTLKLNMSGVSYSLDLKIRRTNWYSSVTCYSKLTLNGISMSSGYHPYTGAVSGATINYTPTQTTSCDSSFSWIPFIGNFIENKASSQVGSAILGMASGFSGKVLAVNPQSSFFSFSDAIQPGTNMIGGFDAGMYIKNNMQNLYTGKTVTVFVSNPYKYDPRPVYSPPANMISGPRFSIMFGDQNGSVGLTLNANKNYTWARR